MSEYYLSCTKCKADGDIRLDVHAPHCMTCGTGFNILHTVNPPCPPYDTREPLRGVRYESELYARTVFKTDAAPVRGAPPALYACHNRPAQPGTYVAPNGYNVMRDGFGKPCSVLQHIDVSHTMSSDCKYSQATDDAKCAGCDHKHRGAAQ